MADIFTLQAARLFDSKITVVFKYRTFKKNIITIVVLFLLSGQFLLFK